MASAHLDFIEPHVDEAPRREQKPSAPRSTEERRPAEQPADVSAAGATDGASVHWDGEPELQEEPERDWRPWLDGRPRRLKRGRDYTGDPKPIVKSAREAAEALGRLAVASRDSQGKYEYLWIQFVDGEVEPGRPCPVCGGTSFAKAQKHFLRCSTCAALLRAAGDSEVEAGEYSMAAPPTRTETVARPGIAEDEQRGEEFTEILGARLLTSDGREMSDPFVHEDFVLHFAFRFLRQVDYALPRVRLSVAGAAPSLRVQPARPLEPSEGETVDARIRVPGNLLMPRLYSVELVLLLIPDHRRPTDYVRVTAADALVLRVRKVGGRSILDASDGAGAGAPRSPFVWDLEVRRDAPV